jgi:hypothetical protein
MVGSADDCSRAIGLQLLNAPAMVGVIVSQNDQRHWLSGQRVHVLDDQVVHLGRFGIEQNGAFVRQVDRGVAPIRNEFTN